MRPIRGIQIIMKKLYDLHTVYVASATLVHHGLRRSAAFHHSGAVSSVVAATDFSDRTDFKPNFIYLSNENGTNKS